MPGNDGFRLDDDQGRSPIAPNFAQPIQKKTIGTCQFGPLCRATQNAKLVPEGEVLQLECGSRFEGGRVKCAERQTEKLRKLQFSTSPVFTIPTIIFSSFKMYI